ncbi:DUF4403 family protein [Salegentibacter sp. F188]|uniref:DUF4403 family protein n=1 Tax=Autumnicola patrickiae TaxID=3075591 RepID=A0ABU3E554_9FLAO|nr:DUF4403 family protein [Salegentibacter sp. F188]MDT0691131.1 DUF4403 family protein [Salegentibacter sp. F188]
MDTIKNIEDSPQGKVIIALPVRAEYYVLEDLLRKKLVGEKVKTEKNGKTSTYAEILDVVLERSLEEEYDLVLELKVRALTSVFRNKEGRLLINLSIDFHEEEQVIMIKDYKLDGNTRNWLLNNFLETVANIFMYNKLKEKMRFDFLPHIQEQLKTINEKLQNRVEPQKGIFVSGDLESIRIRDIVPQEKHLLLKLDIEGMANVDIEKIIL